MLIALGSDDDRRWVTGESEGRQPSDREATPAAAGVPAAGVGVVVGAGVALRKG